MFWLGVAHVSITLWTVLPCLLAASSAAAWMVRKTPLIPPTLGTPQWDRMNLILGLSSVCVGAVLCARVAISPLIGGDTVFRWDFLAQKLLALGNFNFYPPLTAADFRIYFFVDGIPPLVSFTNWWLYASAGSYAPALICVFVTLQFASTLGFVYGTAATLSSQRAGVLAAAMLAGSTLYFNSIVLGRETGLTALGMAAMLYFLVGARGTDDVAAMISGGLAAALCALSREYGWIAVVAGLIVLAWRRLPWKLGAWFGGVATALAGPWYIRNWAIAGNPFYSLHFGSFAVNPIHAAILEHYKTLLGVQQWTAATWLGVFGAFLLLATFQFLAGIPGGFLQFRRHGYLLVIAILLTLVWIQSAAYTSGGLAGSTRVLSPVMVILSITGAAFLEKLMVRKRWAPMAVVAAILLSQGWAAARGALYPYDPASLSLGQWHGVAFQPVARATEFQIADQLGAILPAGYRVLADSAYLHAALAEKGIEVVPVWSPEVRFLFTATPEEAERRLRELKIASAAVYPNSLNLSYLATHSPFYAALPQRWQVGAQIPGVLYLMMPTALPASDHTRTMP